jgi:FkbM family methyltransferase
LYFGVDEIDRQVEKYVDLDRGFFFEAGANDGIRFSNTFYFERYRGWRGLLVEPSPHRFFDCVRNRPRAWVEWGALVPPEWDKPHVDLIYCDMMTVIKGAKGSAEADAAYVESGIPHLQSGETPVEIRSRAWTIDQIIRKHDVTHIDFMSLDLEGFERQALRGLDMDRVRPTWLLVEETIDPEALKGQIEPWYDLVDQLTSHDFLFRAKPA